MERHFRPWKCFSLMFGGVQTQKWVGTQKIYFSSDFDMLEAVGRIVAEMPFSPLKVLFISVWESLG